MWYLNPSSGYKKEWDKTKLILTLYISQITFLMVYDDEINVLLKQLLWASP